MKITLIFASTNILDCIMNTTVVNSPVFNDYWNVIKNWSDEMKAALVAKITESMRNNVLKKNEKSWERYFGIMKDDNFPSASEIDDFMDDEDKDIEKFVV